MASCCVKTSERSVLQAWTHSQAAFCAQAVKCPACCQVPTAVRYACRCDGPHSARLAGWLSISHRIDSHCSSTSVAAVTWCCRRKRRRRTMTYVTGSNSFMYGLGGSIRWPAAPRRVWHMSILQGESSGLFADSRGDSLFSWCNGWEAFKSSTLGLNKSSVCGQWQACWLDPPHCLFWLIRS